MIEPLLARLPNRFILVGGKGGVGKSTTASAIALALADRSESVHLISTDPAHSLHDVFARQTCSARLIIEEFDARTYADRLLARIQPALAELIERGTYLDHADANGFLDLSLPGIDEVMAALRLVDLQRSGVARIVVDTAPTGHTLRLLESGTILRSWVAAGRAMARKAGVVAGQLMRQTVRFAAEDILDEIERDVEIFEREVLHGGAFVVVTRAGKVIGSETDRLIAELKHRGVHVAAMITDRSAAERDDVFVAPRLQAASGCDALRAWVHGLGRADTSSSSRASRGHPSGKAAVWIAAQGSRLIWVAGKGGVGKSTCAAAIATLLSESRSVCVVSTDPAGSLSEVFARPVARDPVAVGNNLFARQIDANAEFAKMRSDYRESVQSVFESLGLETAAQLDRNVVERLFDFAPPGIDEIIALIEILEHAGDYDVTIIDSAPTGHFLRLLQMPEIALQWVHSLLRLLLKYHAVASLDALGEDLLAFAKRLRRLSADLADRETTSVYVVTLAEPVVAAETQRLRTALQNAQIAIAAVVLNRADAAGAQTFAADLADERLISTADENDEVIGPEALRAFVTTWELIGE